jgi:cytidylate kinase
LKTPLVITVDGPSASGKGTLSRRLAEDLGFIYVDTGAMYRTLAWWALEQRLPIHDQMIADEEKKIVALMRRWKAQLKVIGGQAALHINGYRPTKEIRLDPVEHAVPAVARIEKVRDWMVARQRDCLALGNLVMEGRDIGTEVFPLAPLKFFLEADEAERQKRISDRGGATSAARRDGMDSNRRKGMLIPALDAVRINNTGETPDQTYARMRKIVRERLSLG